jgi:carboxypeptidase Q
MLQHSSRHLAALAVFVVAFAAPVTASATESTDLNALSSIRREGFRNSKVMETLDELTDRIGPRLTGSPSMKVANEWTRDRLTSFGLANARLEAWGPFGDGWSQEFASVRMMAPTVSQLYAIPRPWTPGTNGPVRGKVTEATIRTKEDIEKYKGKLAGKIVLLVESPLPVTTPPVAGPTPPVAATKITTPRMTEAELEDVEQYKAPPTAQTRAASLRRYEFQGLLRAFLAEEKPLAVITPNRGGDGTIFVQASGSTQRPDRHDVVPTLTMVTEQYLRISRLLAKKVDVELEVNVAATFYPDAGKQFNTVAELPGSDAKLKEQVVMLGAHLDSWTGSTGATDNAVGCAVVMEAARILKAAGLQPRRTVRVALWSGEEQGLLGSHAYVGQHFAARPEPKDPAEAKLPSGMWSNEGRPLTLKPEHAQLSAYFNLDNGAGKIRGIYTQENIAATPLFESWIAPLKDLDVTAITQRTTGSTDHVSFDEVGLPGFQFIQDPLYYNARTHHSNMDGREQVTRDDLMQSSVVMAWFIYNAAMRDDLLPRKALPKNETEAPAKTPPVASATD